MTVQEVRAKMKPLEAIDRAGLRDQFIDFLDRAVLSRKAAPALKKAAKDALVKVLSEVGTGDIRVTNLLKNFRTRDVLNDKVTPKMLDEGIISRAYQVVADLEETGGLEDAGADDMAGFDEIVGADGISEVDEEEDDPDDSFDIAAGDTDELPEDPVDGAPVVPSEAALMERQLPQVNFNPPPPPVKNGNKPLRGPAPVSKRPVAGTPQVRPASKPESKTTEPPKEVPTSAPVMVGPPKKAEKVVELALQVVEDPSSDGASYAKYTKKEMEAELLIAELTGIPFDDLQGISEMSRKVLCESIRDRTNERTAQVLEILRYFNAKPCM